MNNTIVEFSGRFHKQNNCICDCCHSIGNVAVLRIPITKYRKSNCFREPVTKMKELWICDECRHALTNLLNRLEKAEIKG